MSKATAHPCPWRDAQALCQVEWLERWGDLMTELREVGRDATPQPPAWLVGLRRWPTDWPTSGPPPADVADWARKVGIGEVLVILSELGARANQGKPPEGWKVEGITVHPPEALDG